MLNPDELWQNEGFFYWCDLVPDLIKLDKLEENKPGMAMSRVYKTGFKTGVLVADHCFYKKLAPEHRQN